MTFLLVIIWALTALMGSLAMARFYKSKTVAEASSSGRNTPAVFWVTFIVIFVFLVVFAYTLSSSDGHLKGSPSARSSQGQRMSGDETAPPQAEEFHLKVGEETPTVEAGPGTHHRLWANKPYKAVSIQKDGSRINYSMPAGYETWNGAEPSGRLRLIGIEEDTIVRILNLTPALPTIHPTETKGRSEAPPIVKKPETSITPEQGESTYKPGAALLEIFKTDSIDKVSDLVPVIKTFWKQNLACTWSGDPWDRENPWLVHKNYGDVFLLPERAREIGATPGYVYTAPYIARFSFYYEAKQSGKYGFNIIHGKNACKITIGGVDIIKAQTIDSATQGVCNLEKGFHRIEFWLVSNIHAGKGSPYFTVTVFTPDASDAVPITKDMLLMKEDTSTPK